MRKTRSSKASRPSAEDSSISTSSIPPPESDENPPKLFILPKETSPEARIVTLPNPRNSAPTRYYFCPERGVYEFTKIAAPKGSPRSWLLAPPQAQPPAKKAIDAAASSEQSGSSTGPGSDAPAETRPSEHGSILSKGYTTRSADLFVATPLDPLFLIVPALAPAPGSESSSGHLFLSDDDHFDALASTSRHYGIMLQNPRLRAAFKARMGVVCDTVDAGGDCMYRLSVEKLMRELLRKASEVVDSGLPMSLEERFVGKVLEAPAVCVKREENLAVAGPLEQEDGIPQDTIKTQTPATESRTDSQASTTSTVTTATDITEPCTPPGAPPSSAPASIVRLLRLRTALAYITTTYTPAHLALFPQPSLIDFTPLTEHLTHLASLREEAFESRSFGNFSRKRALDGDEESEELRAEKKRKKEEEEEKKKRAGESRAIKGLRKVDVRGMKKLSDFFGRT
ncbi:hypothetical protein GP486_005908 [Trichoglossum hirsutum]|uniref:Ribonuclease H2 subunit B n=1 Tax=Trichoglossum hirsutum TaxID=265104 RepID=A0A9P8L8B2_9PEZI|nr:hypothetical protein GP486_005908 [Trichoglossum hirsutum]